MVLIVSVIFYCNSNIAEPYEAPFYMTQKLYYFILTQDECVWRIKCNLSNNIHNSNSNNRKHNNNNVDNNNNNEQFSI